MNYTALSLVESFFGLDGGAMFGIVPKPLWERTNPADSANRIAMAARCLLLTGDDGRRILIDTGMGTKWSEKEADIYRVEHVDGTLHQALAAHGIAPETIGDVIMTHLHFDHAGGLMNADGNAMSPAFPDATHWVQRENWVWANHPTPRDAGSYRAENFALLGTVDGPPLELLDGDAGPAPGIRLIPLRGHTPGMQMVEFSTGRNTVVFAADLFPTAGHINPVWVMGYDVFPLDAVREKTAFLERALAEDLVIAFQHDPTTPFGRPRRDPKGRWYVEPVDASML
jgi:glyoxylase-like metal-dependent hydrolase (beta-lactamase superfamily II)